jgi:hypothetical protein
MLLCLCLSACVLSMDPGRSFLSSHQNAWHTMHTSCFHTYHPLLFSSLGIHIYTCSNNAILQ